ncbi:MAG: 23S rRNA (guanosine(2251)-2'-O)-methyltransferase RlmB [Thermomicrobiales bacterium]
MKTRRPELAGRGGGDNTSSRRNSDTSSQRQGGPSRSGGSPSRSGGPSRGGGSGRPPGRGGSRPPSGDGSRKRYAGDDGPKGRPSRTPSRKPKTEKAPAPVLARTGRDLIYGRNAVIETLQGRRTIERLFVAEGVREDDRMRTLLALAAKRKVAVERIPRLMLDDATRGANHQGVALEAEAYRYATLEDIVAAPGSVLVFDHLQDPQNVGSLFRAAEAAGVAGVLLPQNRAAEVTPAVVNASAGAVEHLRVAVVPSLAHALEELKGSGRWVVGLDGGPNSSPLFETEVPTPVALVVGAEGHGISGGLRKQCDLILALPMRGRVESLNASTAGAIALYEIVRREEAAQRAAGADA